MLFDEGMLMMENRDEPDKLQTYMVMSVQGTEVCGSSEERDTRFLCQCLPLSGVPPWRLCRQWYLNKAERRHRHDG